MDKPTLKYATETTYVVTYRDLEAFIEAATGQWFSFSETAEGGNDTQHRRKVKPLTHIDDYDDYADIKKNGAAPLGTWYVALILSGLCGEGYIPAGTYIITVCW